MQKNEPSGKLMCKWCLRRKYELYHGGVVAVTTSARCQNQLYKCPSHLALYVG